MIFYSDINQQDNLTDEKLYDLEAIYQSIHNIINTQKGQRLFLPEFGVDLWQFLFDPMSPAIQHQVYMEVYRAIKVWEPRVEIQNSQSSYIGNPETHTIDLNIVFILKGELGEKYVYQTSLSNTQKENYYEL